MENWPQLKGYFEPAQKNRKRGRRKNKDREEKKETRPYKRRWREGIARVWEQSVKSEGREKGKAF